MKKLLILTDLTDASINTYRYGLQLAHVLQAEIVLLYCTGEASLTMTGQFNHLQRLRSFAERYAFSVEETMGHLPAVECFVTAGEPVSAFSRMVETRQIDLLLAGEYFLENLPSASPLPLPQLVPCPALLVPRDAAFRKIKELVFATDFTDQHAEVARGVCKLAALLKARITFLHFYARADRGKLALFKQHARELKELVADCRTDFRLIEEEDLLEGLNDYAEKFRADIFVLATQDSHLLQQYFLKTYRKTQAHITHLPLLNLYQERKSPCSAGCTYCHSGKAKTEYLAN